MMKGKIFQLIFALIIFGVLGYFLWTKMNDNKSILHEVSEKVPTGGNASELAKTYNSDILPTDELLNAKNPLSAKMYKDLKERYKKDFVELIADIKSTGAKPVLCWVTTEIGIAQTPVQMYGKIFIKQLCVENGVEFNELGGPILNNLRASTFMPKDGHFNKLGAKYICDFADGIISRYKNVNSKVTYSDKERSELFGDGDVSVDEIRDGGKGLPYRLKVNKQGLRMNYDLKFPKKKRRILFIGDSEFFFPFLDNENTAEGQLQTKHPELEILNAANWGYSIDDYLSLWKERAKYSEPDVVLLQSSGTDITDLFFTNRMKFSRHREHLQPTELEKQFYEALTKSAGK